MPVSLLFFNGFEFQVMTGRLDDVLAGSEAAILRVMTGRYSATPPAQRK
jgi:hypothetical protein